MESSAVLAVVGMAPPKETLWLLLQPHGPQSQAT